MTRMSIAELHGKLSSTEGAVVHDGMEDLLTSDVFGAMLYSGWQSAFQSWFLGAQAVPNSDAHTSIAEFLPGPQAPSVAYAFWPRLPNNREPDVVIWIKHDDGSSNLIAVEAKLWSGLSGNTQLLDEAQGVAQVSDAQVQKWTFRPPLTAVMPAIRRKALVYLTQHSSLPVTDFLLPPNESFAVPVFWLSWRTLSRHLRCYSPEATSMPDLILADLRKLLGQKHLRDFTGFQQQPFGDLGAAPFYAAGTRKIGNRKSSAQSSPRTYPPLTEFGEPRFYDSRGKGIGGRK
jgi:hypothetical protein